MALSNISSVNRYLKTLAVFMSVLVISLPVIFASSLNPSWDANGNLIGGDGFFRVYNSFNQLSKVYQGDDENGVLRFEFTYHPTEERVLIKKVYNESGDLTETVYYVNENLVRTVDESGTRDTTYIYHEGQLVAERQDDGTKIFYHPDHLGSTSLTTDSNGDMVEETFYTPFGLVLSGGSSSRYDYEAKEYDDVVEDYDFNFRKYKAAWGIFTQPDTLIKDAYNPQTLNRYSFEHNNPYNRVDPTGHIAPLLLGGIIVVGAAGIGALVSIGSQLLVHREVKSWGKVKASALVAGGAALATILLAPAGLAASISAVVGELGVATVGAVAFEDIYLIDEVLNKLEEECKGPFCKEDSMPEVSPPPPQDTDGGSSGGGTSGSGIISGSTSGSSSGTGGGGCVPTCSTACYPNPDGTETCYTACTVCP